MFLKFSTNKQAEWPDTGRSKAVWGQTLTPTEADEIKKFIESRGWAL